MPRHDVIVVGAGFTGLTAASHLKDAGLDVVLLEARERVGGKVQSAHPDNGARVDTGGQFFCHEMHHLMALITKHGKKPVTTNSDGRTVFQPPALPQEGNARLQQVEHVRAKAKGCDLNDPALQGLTVADWIDRQHLPADVASSFGRLVKGLWCRSPEEIAFTFLASNDRRVTNTVPEMEFFLKDTMHSLAEDIASEIGSVVQTETPVTEIAYSSLGVDIIAGGRPFTADRLVVALPPVMIRRLQFFPALPVALQTALDAWSPGYTIKVQVSYSAPFWRKRGLNGTIVWEDPHGLYASDASHDDYAGLVVFVSGPCARHWHPKPQSELGAFLRAKLVDALGAEAGEIQDLVIRDWVDDAWCAGGYGDVLTDLNMVGAEATISDGISPLIFASSEMSPSYPGYVEGAIVAGGFAASRVIDELERSRNALCLERGPCALPSSTNLRGDVYADRIGATATAPLYPACAHGIVRTLSVE